MIWFWGVLCALALVALFFPFVIWVDFAADLNRVEVRFRFFKKELYTYTKSFKKEPEETEGLFESSAPVPVEKEAAPKSVPEEKIEEEKKDDSLNEPEPKTEVEKKTEPEKPAEPEIKKEIIPQVEPEKKLEIKEEIRPEEKSQDKNSKEEIEDEPEKKRSLTDVEFWTLLLTPEFDVRAWWAVRHELSALFKLFRIRFVDCFVEGIRMQEYESMGYAAALNGLFKSFPYIGDWDFRMDWTRDHEPKAEGHLRASVNLCRTLGLILATLFYGGIVAWTFWRRRAHILKTGELPELGFIRNKIVKIMSEDD